MKHMLYDRLLCCLLTLCLLACSLSVTASAETVLTRKDLETRAEGWEEFPYAPEVAGWSYSFSTMKIYDTDEAQKKNAPAGHTGYVMELTGSSELGFIVDFTDMHIPMSIVKAIRFRVHYPATTKEVRAAEFDGTRCGGWLMRYVADKPNTWNDIVLDSPAELAKMANKDGTLRGFAFGVRFNGAGSGYRAWVDCIEVELIPGDNVPPVLTYEGSTEISWTAGKPISVDATAYDEYEKSNMPITYEWAEGALDGNGLPVEGDHICHVCATDSFGNRSTVKLTVHVGPRDTEAPRLGLRAKTVRTFAGTCADALVIPVTDNTDTAITAVQTWSDGALDILGRLIGGTHTLTVTATDLTGNETTTVVTVIVE